MNLEWHGLKNICIAYASADMLIGRLTADIYQIFKGKSIK